VLKLTREQIAEGLLRAAILFQQVHRQSLSKTFPPASKIGQYPAARTFNLRDSVTYQPGTLAEIGKELKVKLGYFEHAWYGARLELKMGRLGLEHTMDRLRHQIAALLGSKEVA
jgi:hypothetical protein